MEHFREKNYASKQRDKERFLIQLNVKTLYGGIAHQLFTMTGSQMTMPAAVFPSADSKMDLEEGTRFMPRFDKDGLITCVTLDARDGCILMLAHMNAESLRLTLETGEAHYWSRSRQKLWRKGETSGQIQKVSEIHTDCDQDAILLSVVPGGDGGACHTGRRSCFYRRVVIDEKGVALVFDQ